MQLYHIDELDLAVASILTAFGFLVLLATIFGRVIRVNLHLSDIIIFTILGIAFGTTFFPGETLDLNPKTFFHIILWTTRLVLAFQLMSTALSLGSGYLTKHWKSQLMLLLVVMPLMWLTSTLLIYAIFRFNFLNCLLIGGILTPTDPILAATIVRGTVAEKFLPDRLRYLISAESGANDGLAFPFVELPILLLANSQTKGAAIGMWFYWTWLYQIIAAAIVFFIVGALAALALTFSEDKNIVDRKTYFVYTVGLSLFTLSAAILANMNEILSVFIAGLGFVYFAKRDDVISEEQVQESIDLFSTFLFFGGFGIIIPWQLYGLVGLGHLFLAGFVVLIFRRILWLATLYFFIPDIHDFYEALFVGWFGPIGVAAIYYSAIIYLELGDINPFIVASFIVLISTLLHGITSSAFTRLIGLHIARRNRHAGSIISLETVDTGRRRSLFFNL